MATSARIAVKSPDGVYHSVYCHYDGYPEVVGKLLDASYNGQISALRLVSEGNMSSLESPDERRSGPYEVSKTLEDLLDLHSRGDEFFLYVYEDDEWKFIKAYGEEINNKSAIDFKSLSDVIN